MPTRINTCTQFDSHYHDVRDTYLTPSVAETPFVHDSFHLGETEDEIWPADVEKAFQEAYTLYPSTGRTKIKGCDGRLYGRNELISKHIYEKTGKIRSRKQVSSHIQVLVKKFSRDVVKSENLQLPTPRPSISYSDRNYEAAQTAIHNHTSQSSNDKISARMHFDRHYGTTPITPTSARPHRRSISSNVSGRTEPYSARYSANSAKTTSTPKTILSLDMMLSAAIYLDRSLAKRVGSVSGSILRLRDLEAVFNWHCSTPSAFVSCSLESKEALKVKAVTKLYSFGQCILTTEHDKMQMYYDYDKWIYSLDQKEMSNALLRIVGEMRNAPREHIPWTLETVHVRLLLKWSREGKDEAHDELYFTLNYKHLDDGSLSLVFNQLAL